MSELLKELSKYYGQIISVMIEREPGKWENDIGTLQGVDNSFIYLKPNNPKFSVELIVLREDIIRSIWVQKKGHKWHGTA